MVYIVRRGNFIFFVNNFFDTAGNPVALVVNLYLFDQNFPDSIFLLQEFANLPLALVFDLL